MQLNKREVDVIKLKMGESAVAIKRKQRIVKWENKKDVSLVKASNGHMISVQTREEIMKTDIINKLQ